MKKEHYLTPWKRDSEEEQIIEGYYFSAMQKC